MAEKRWYDKDSNLRVAFELIQKLDEKHQKIIAKDILKMIKCEIGLNLEKEINEIAKSQDNEYKRWYDRNIELFVSFEIIKGFPKELKAATARKILETALSICFREGGSDE